ncbi:MAG: DUF4065 domain-containing protein [Phyllobacteriaceae bacterium]|nr:DUF4065 domain-containing protein [Phyllobacteriaceae bacterium]
MNDPRGVANAIIDCAQKRGVSCTNLKLQKLLFFAHGRWLMENPEPLCSGTFEAWQHGPVHPVVYRAFQPFGSGTITEKAQALNPVTRELTEIREPQQVEVWDTITSVVKHMGHLTGSQLRNLSHAKGSAWSVIVQASHNSANVGLQIPNQLIRDTFGKHVYLLGNEPEEGDLSENAPYS